MTTKAGAKPARKQTSEIFAEARSFSSFSVNDLQQAKEFYGDKLGLDVAETKEGLELNAGDNAVFIYSKPNHAPASFTVLNFPVEDIEAAIEELNSVGIKLEQYNLPDIKTDERGIARPPHGPTIAWFKDPAGNILSVVQPKEFE